jgi:hypothetical protein
MSKPVAMKTHAATEPIKLGSVIIRPTREDAEQDIDLFYTLHCRPLQTAAERWPLEGAGHAVRIEGTMLD